MSAAFSKITSEKATPPRKKTSQFTLDGLKFDVIRDEHDAIQTGEMKRAGWTFKAQGPELLTATWTPPGDKEHWILVDGASEEALVHPNLQAAVAASGDDTLRSHAIDILKGYDVWPER